VSAGCVFPLSQREELSKQLGTRHRAAIGLTEETDAFVLVVSEETGTISVAYRGRLRRGFDEARLSRVLQSILGRGRRKEVEGRARSPVLRWLRMIWPRPAGVAPAKVEDHVQHP
jgi:diadenylate cyclase